MPCCMMLRRFIFMCKKETEMLQEKSMCARCEVLSGVMNNAFSSKACSLHSRTLSLFIVNKATGGDTT